MSKAMKQEPTPKPPKKAADKKTEIDFAELEAVIGVSFQDKNLLRQAFVHRSYLNENKSERIDHNERLEFLGDAVLELISTVFLYKKFPTKQEGDLTAYRSALVNAVNLAEVAVELGIDKYLLLSRGEAKDTGKARQYILANTMESLIGAMYLDQDYAVVEQFVIRAVMSRIDHVIETGAFIDAKSLFQERAQEHTSITPSYKVIREVGPDHDKKFIMAVYIGTEKIAEGEGKSKQEAEQAAAHKGLKVKGWGM